MSTLRVSTILDQAGENQSTPEGIANGTAKAWVNFNGGGTVAIRASYNVSSITDKGTGDYRVNFTTAMADVNYAVTTSATGFGWVAPDTYATGSVELTTFEELSGSFPLTDNSIVCVSIFR